MIDVYRAIADPTRRLILDELTRRDGLTLFEICARLAAVHGSTSTRQAISQHLDVLAQADLVHTERVGRTKVIYLDITGLRAIVDRWHLDAPPSVPNNPDTANHPDTANSNDPEEQS